MMDLKAQQDNKLLNLKCLEHKKQIQYVYLKDDANSQLACSTCFVQKKLAHKFIIEIDDFLNNTEAENLKKLLPEVNQESIKNSNKDEEIEKVEKQFDEFSEVILSNIDKLKKQLINNIISTQDQRLTILKIINNASFIEYIKAQIHQFSDDPMKLNDQLKYIISAINTCLQNDKKKIQDSRKNPMNEAKQINLKDIDNSQQSTLQKLVSPDILQEDLNNTDSNQMFNQIPSPSLIEEELEIESIENLKSIPNLQFYQNIYFNLQEQNIGDQEMKELCDKLKQCKKINSIIFYFNNNSIGDQGIDYLCELISDMKYLTDFKLFFFNNMDITEIGVSQLTQALQLYSTQIKSLHLGLNHNKNISHSVVLTSLIPLFSSGINLSELGLWLSFTQITGKTVKEIANMMKSLPMLKNVYLSLCANNIDDESIIYLSNEGIKPLNSQIQELYLLLSLNELTDQSAISLMNTISTIFDLKEINLDLSNNRIGKECIQQLEQFKLTLKDQHCNNLTMIEIDYDNQE